MNRMFKADVKEGNLIIQNTTNIEIDCLLKLTDIFCTDRANGPLKFTSGEIKVLPLINYNFTNETTNEIFYLEVYQNQELIFTKKIGDKSKCFVVFSNQKFESLVEQLIVGLDKYSDEKIFHYCVNYDSKLNYHNLENIRFDVDGDMNDTQFIQLLKPLVFIDILKRGWRGVAFIDADIQVRSNINDVFNCLSEIDKGPIFQKGPYHYTMVNGIYIPGPLLSKVIGVSGQNFPYFVTNVAIFNHNHLSLFEEWLKVCQSEEINAIRKFEFMHDEVILNALMWKLNIKPKMKCFCLNAIDNRCVEFFYNFKYKENGFAGITNLNDFGLGHFSQSFIPYNKNEIVGFHCVKDVSMAKFINYIISTRDKEII